MGEKSEMAKVGIGVIGLGRMGLWHARSIAKAGPEAKLIAVCDIQRELVENIAKELEVTAYREYGQILENPDIDAVLVVTPSDRHTQVVMDAVKAGKHVFCEKPIATTIEDAKRIADAVAKAGIKFQVGYMRRFDPAYREAKKMIEEGRIGEPVVFTSISKDPFPPPEWACDPKRGGGLYIDMHSHDFDLARWFMKDEIKRIYAEDGALVYKNFKISGWVDNTIVNLKFQRGSIGVIIGSFSSGYGYDIRAEIQGTEGAIAVGEIRWRPVVFYSANGVIYPSMFKTNNTPHFMQRFNEAYIEEIRQFIHCIINDTEPLVTAKDAKIALEMSIAALRSSQERRPIEIALQLSPKRPREKEGN